MVYLFLFLRCFDWNISLKELLWVNSPKPLRKCSIKEPNVTNVNHHSYLDLPFNKLNNWALILPNSTHYTRSSDSAPSISAILRLVLIGKLPKSSFSALLELNTKSFPLRLVLFFGLIQTVLPQLVLCFCWPKKSTVQGPSVICFYNGCKRKQELVFCT